MATVTRLGDLGASHDACPNVPLVTASTNVYINGRGAGRVGDNYQSHGCIIHPEHTPIIASGSSTVYVNGRPLARVGDSSNCGGTVAQGSPNVFAG